ncbi:cation transport protein [Sarocladium implicatum]|nr:cation transport protein [Sarocladium implicatum]
MASLRRSWSNYLENHHNVDKVVSTIGHWLPPLNYITIHYAYFIIGCLVSSLIFWGSSEPFRKFSYVDSLFMVTSAFTNTGLNTVNVSDLTTWQQVLLWLLMIIGSPIWVSLWTVMVRKSAFERRFKDIVEAERDMKKRQASLRRAPALHDALKMSKPKTEPPSMTQMPGLGTRPLLAAGIDNTSTDLAGIGAPARRLHSEPTLVARTSENGEPGSTGDHISFAIPQSPQTRNSINVARELSLAQRRPSSDSDASSSIDLEDFLFHWEKILGKHNVSHNGQFHGLSSEEREQIGGCEYRALKILALTVPMYFVLWQLFGALALGAWMSVYAKDRSAKVHAHPWWAGIFLAISAFNNAGMALFDDSLISFGRSYFVLIVVAFLILAGNTAYPILLRFIIWSLLRILNATTSERAYGPWKETLQFILKYPRRVYTTLFPSRATWWLLTLLLVINSIDWVCFEILNINNNQVEALGLGQRIMDGWFQSISVRAAGVTVIPLPSLYIAMQVVYLIMMYISVYPVVITMRTSNVYEERSLGIYSDDKSVLSPTASNSAPFGSSAGASENPFVVPSRDEPNRGQFLRRRKTGAVIGDSMKRAMTFNGVGVPAPSTSKGGEESSRVNFIAQQIRGQLAHDLWWLVLAVFFIVLIETSHFMQDPVSYSVFNVLFEGVSAYGCVGLSIGFPGKDYSFVGAWHFGSKLVLCLVMLRGRHRGLPVAVDRAVRLPGEKMHQEEEEDSKMRRTMTMQRFRSQET